MATPSNAHGGRIRAISALRDIYRTNGPDGLGDVLALSSAWPDEDEDHIARTYHVLLGLAAFEKTYRDRYDADRMMGELRRLDPRIVIRRARQLTAANRLNSSKAMVPVLRDVYNKSFGRGNHAARLY